MTHESPFLDRLRQTLRAFDAEMRRDVSAGILDAAEEFGMWMDDRPAGREVPVALEPSGISPAEHGDLHHAAWQLRRALQRVPEIIDRDPRAADLLPLSQEERAWFERFRSPLDASTSRFCRIDALYRPSANGTEPEQLSFIEPNVVGLGGLCYAVDSVDLLERELFSRHLSAETIDMVATPADPRMLLGRELGTWLRQNGISGGTVCLVGSRTGYETDGEDQQLVTWMDEACGFDVIFADPGELELAGGDVTAHGRRVDLIYRMMELSDLVDRQKQGGDLSVMQEAFDRGIVIPTVGGDLEHKSVFELFTNKQFSEHFSARQRAVFDRHVLWTRMFTDRETAAPSGRTVDLPTFVRRERENLVLKPNRSYGGFGVTLGCRTPAGEWSSLVDQALRDDASYVVQQLAPLVSEQLPVIEGESFGFRDVYTVVGIFPSTHGCGLLGRYASEGVVNVSKSGGVRACVLDFS